VSPSQSSANSNVSAALTKSMHDHWGLYLGEGIVLILLGLAAIVFPFIAGIVATAAISCILLATYNFYAFGKITGPYQSGALEFGKSSIMVLVGLCIDQNQGFVFQNPINLLGIFACGALYFHNRQFAMLVLMVFLSLIFPNSLHPNWYGGWSVSGRFEWSATIVFLIPTIFGLIRLSEINRRMLWAAIFTSGFLQIYFCRNR